MDNYQNIMEYYVDLTLMKMSRGESIVDFYEKAITQQQIETLFEEVKTATEGYVCWDVAY